MSWHAAERRFAWPDMPATGMQTLSNGQYSRTQSNVEIAILNCICCGTGSQWSMSRRAGVMCSYLPAPMTKRAAAFRTSWSRRMTCEETPYRNTDNCGQPSTENRQLLKFLDSCHRQSMMVQCTAETSTKFNSTENHSWVEFSVVTGFTCIPVSLITCGTCHLCVYVTCVPV